METGAVREERPELWGRRLVVVVVGEDAEIRTEGEEALV